MPRQYRFMFFSAIVGLVTLLAFLAVTNVTPGIAQTAGTPAATTSAAEGDPARGKYLVQIAGCDMCHGAPSLAVNGVVPLAGGREFKLGQLGTFYSFNLTTLQNWSTTDFDRAIRQGLQPRANRVLAPFMPYAIYHFMSDSDVASIGAYLRSLTPVKNDIPPAQIGPGLANLKPLPAASIPSPKADDSADTGRYLVEAVANCGLCHTSRDSGGVIKGREYSGGRRNYGTQDTPIYPPAILGSVLSAEGYSPENFAATLRLGIRPRGAPLNPAMPWHRYMNMTDTDLAAVWNFLQTRKLDSPWPVQTPPPPPTAAATQQSSAAGTPASTAAQ